MIPIRFFTCPVCIRYPLKYVVVNPFTFLSFMSWMREYGDAVEEILLDTGVDRLFKHLNMPDYPNNFIQHYISLIQFFDRMFGGRYKVFVVIPDIPVDYPRRDSLYPYNVQKTIKYIKYFLDNVVYKYDNIIFIAPIQGRKDSIPSVVNTYFSNIDLYREFKYVAIAPTCSTKKYSLLANMVMRMDNILYKYGHKYHVFGMHLNALKMVHHKVKSMYSFDSTAYYIVNGKYCSCVKRTKCLLKWLRKLPSNIIY